MNLNNLQNRSLKTSGLLLFLSGFAIFMGVITGEIYYPWDFSTRNSYISELAAALPPVTETPEPSAQIFNSVLMASGIMILSASLLIIIHQRKWLIFVPLALFGTGLLGVGIFPGNVVPWHGIFAMAIFLAGGIGAVFSFSIVKAPLRYVFILIGLVALLFLFLNKLFIPAMGVGGAERWIFYPEVFWITGLGGYLMGLQKAS